MTNYVVLYIGGEPWTLAGVCFFGGIATLVVWVVLIFLLTRRWGRMRALSTDEAARVAINAGDQSYVDRAVPIHGPARGVEAKVQYSASTLREAWHAKDYERFFGLPAMGLMGVFAFELIWFSCYLAGGPKMWPVVIAVNVILVPIALGNLFLMWAALFTKLE